MISRPRYSPLRCGGDRARALIVTDAPAIPGEALADATTPDDFGERWMIRGDSRAIPAPAAGGDHWFRSRDHLLIALDHRLARERMGLRLYAAGSEPFVWDVHGIAARFGLGGDEMFLHASGDVGRRVRCSHCRTVTEGVRTTIATCAGCGVALLVRDHFSRRLNAYAGVQVDAEEAGAVPPALPLDA